MGTSPDPELREQHGVLDGVVLDMRLNVERSVACLTEDYYTGDRVLGQTSLCIALHRRVLGAGP